MEKENEFKGFSLFNDIENAELKEHNRAAVLYNMFEMNRKGEKISENGAKLIYGYFLSIPAEERGDVKNRLEGMLKKGGYTVERQG